MEADDFYLDFVEPMREEKDLSTFIVNLMKLYYENEAVRDEFVKFDNENNPISQIRKRLDVISVEHQKTVLATEALKDLIKTEESGAYSEVGKRSTAIKQSLLPTAFAGMNSITDVTTGLSDDEEDNISEQGKNPTPTVIESRLRKLESVLPSIASIESKLDILLTGRFVSPMQKEEPIQQGSIDTVHNKQTPSISEVIHPTPMPPVEVAIPNVMPINQVQNISTQDQVANNSSNTMSISTPKNQPLVDYSPINSESSENTEETAPVTKPASFGKLLGSMKR